MAYPPAYERDFSFSEWETLHPGEPKPGASLDTEFDDVSVALTATQDALALIQRDDGALANDSVGEDQLQDDVFDGIVDGITADAEAAASAAAASAAAAAGSASAANTSANTASTQAGLAAGSAALAGTSQSIAQTAANDAAASAAAADVSANEAELAANETSGSVAEAQLSAELAFKWAEYLAAPVEPAPGGWPEAVDDGMWSAKWWALRSRDYNAVSHIDLGSGQADIGAAWEEWLALGNEQPLGLIYVTWGSPPLEYALTDPSAPEDPDSWTLITGGIGPPGPPCSLTIGTVTTGAPGSAASASITGVPPDQVLSLTIPQGNTGATGATGPAGPVNTLAIGTVTTGAAGSPAAATITGTAPNQTLNLTIPQGDQGIQGIQGIQGPQGIQGIPGSGSPANPSALVGLAAVNGSALTFIRSDGAPALDQAIAPTWTGTHTWSAASPVLAVRDTSAVTDTKNFLIRNPGGAFSIASASDAAPLTAARNLMTGVRSGVAWSGITFGNIADNPTFAFLGTGAGTSANPWTWTGQHSFETPNTTWFGFTAAEVTAIKAGAFIWNNDGADSLHAHNRLRVNRLNGTPNIATIRVNGAYNAMTPMLISEKIGAYFFYASRAAATSVNAAAEISASATANWTPTSTPTMVEILACAVGSTSVTSVAKFATDAVTFPANVLVSPLTGTPIITTAPTGSIGGLRVNGNGVDDVEILVTTNPAGNAYARFTNTGGQNWSVGNQRSTGYFFISNGVGVGSPLLTIATDGTTTIPGKVVHTKNGATNNAAVQLFAPSNPFFYLSQTGATTDNKNWDMGVDTEAMLFRCINDANNAARIWLQVDRTGIAIQSLAFGNTTDNPPFLFLGTGATTFSGAVTAVSFNASSSRAVKRETGKPSRVADMLARLRPVLYRLLSDDSREQLGLIAEEVHEICPQMSDGKTISYDRLAVLLLADWQDAHGVA